MTVERNQNGDVYGCKTHTRLDDKGTRFRIGPCGKACFIVREAEEYGPGRRGLSNMIVKLWGYKDEDLMKADAAKAAKLYGVSEDHAAGYIKLEKLQRGLVAP